jgi:hypothetical protein
MVREGVVLMIGQGVSCCFLMPDIANEISDLFVRNLNQGQKSFLLFLRGMLRQTLGSLGRAVPLRTVENSYCRRERRDTTMKWSRKRRYWRRNQEPTPSALIRVILNGQIRVRRGWGGGGAWCGGGAEDTRDTPA